MEPQASTGSSGNYQPIYEVYSLASHPYNRGLVAGLFNHVLSQTNGNFIPGFFFGAISGVTNVALRGVCKRIDARTASVPAKVVNYIFATTMPWAMSVGIMHMLYKSTDNMCFRIHGDIALGAAFATEVCAASNLDLLGPEKTNTNTATADTITTIAID